MTPPITEFRVAFAAHLTDILELEITAHRPATPRSSTGFIRSAVNRRYLDYKVPGATWCQPMVSFDLILIAPPIPALAEVDTWFEAAAALLAAAGHAAPVMGNGRRMPPVQAWSGAGPLDYPGTNLMAVEVEFMPVPIRSS